MSETQYKCCWCGGGLSVPHVLKNKRHAVCQNDWCFSVGPFCGTDEEALRAMNDGPKRKEEFVRYEFEKCHWLRVSDIVAVCKMDNHPQWSHEVRLRDKSRLYVSRDCKDALFAALPDGLESQCDKAPGNDWVEVE